jgi:hypothetical protein
MTRPEPQKWRLAEEALERALRKGGLLLEEFGHRLGAGKFLRGGDAVLEGLLRVGADLGADALGGLRGDLGRLHHGVDVLLAEAGQALEALRQLLELLGHGLLGVGDKGLDLGGRVLHDVGGVGRLGTGVHRGVSGCFWFIDGRQITIMLRCVKIYAALRQKLSAPFPENPRYRGFPSLTSRDSLTENKAFAP